MIRTLLEIGPLRLLLLGFALVIMILAPDGQVQEVRAGWGLVTTVLVPALAPMVVMGLLLDALMNRVWMAGASEAARPRHRRILWLNLLASGAVLIALYPFLRSLAG